VTVLGQLGTGYIDDEVLETIGRRSGRIMLADISQAQVDRDLAGHGIVLDKGDYAHAVLALGAGRGIDRVAEV